MQIVQKIAVWLRRTLLDLAGNVSLFLLAAFIIPHLMCGFPAENMAKLAGWLETYLVFPWGTALCLLTLSRRENAGLQKPQADFCVMFMMMAWITVPFIYRFGWTLGNLSGAHGYMIVFFGLYASIVTQSAQRCGKLLDMAAAVFAVFSFFYAGALLYAAWGNTSVGYQFVMYPFGMYVHNGSNLLFAGVYYNGTALAAAFGSMLCLIGYVRRKNLLAKIAHLVPGVMMILVVILTQSRTTRYALIIAFAAVAYGYIASGSWHERAVVRHMAGILAGVLIAAGGYVGAAKITDAALYRYALVDMQRSQLEEEAAADETQTEAGEHEDAPAVKTEAKSEIKPIQSRGAGNASFTGRTNLWSAAIRLWKKNPKNFLIGMGHSRSTEIFEKFHGHRGYNVHNAYFQVIQDYGLIGFALLMALLALAVPHAWRIFFARREKAVPGGRLLLAMIIMGLVSGLMEIEVFHMMRYTNLAFFYALGMIVVLGRDMVE